MHPTCIDVRQSSGVHTLPLRRCIDLSNRRTTLAFIIHFFFHPCRCPRSEFSRIGRLRNKAGASSPCFLIRSSPTKRGFKSFPSRESRSSFPSAGPPCRCVCTSRSGKEPFVSLVLCAAGQASQVNEFPVYVNPSTPSLPLFPWNYSKRRSPLAP